ncbi:MAG: PepSY domain-containing protein [Thiohalobacterales bacterium]|nr:PepSY domain-containing protein [Thiohalobacterales bacterium]
MDRNVLITIHMYLSAFFAPAVLLVAISGGLYLFGIKGKVETDSIFQSDNRVIDTSSASLKDDIAALLAEAGVEAFSFEYVKVKGDTLYTRPTSSEHSIINLNPGGVEVVHARPSLQKRMIELHMGHGPTAFKTFQKVFAIGLILVMISGLWLGISAQRLRRSTSLTFAAGTLAFGLLLL